MRSRYNFTNYAGLVRDILETRSETILRDHERLRQMSIEGIASIMSRDNPRILRSKLEALYLHRPSDEYARSQEVSLEDLGGRLRATSVWNMSPELLTDIFHDMAFTARKQGISTLEQLADSVEDQLLRHCISLSARGEVHPLGGRQDTRGRSGERSSGPEEQVQDRGRGCGGDSDGKAT